MTTYITFVLDETGSMDPLRQEAISGFNSYLETLKKNLKGRTSFSLLKFDSYKLEWFVKNKPIKDVPDLNEGTYRPGAMTPLWDAVAHAIQETEARVKGKKKPTVILTILTDGYENASREYTSDQVKKMIEEHDGWAFNFVGAGVDAWDITAQIGIQKGSTITTPATAKGMSSGMGAVAAASASYASMDSSQQSAVRSSSGFYNGKKTAEEVVDNLTDDE